MLMLVEGGGGRGEGTEARQRANTHEDDLKREEAPVTRQDNT